MDLALQSHIECLDIRLGRIVLFSGELSRLGAVGATTMNVCGVQLVRTVEPTCGGPCPPYGKWWAVATLRFVGRAHPTGNGGRCPPYGRWWAVPTLLMTDG